MRLRALAYGASLTTAVRVGLGLIALLSTACVQHHYLVLQDKLPLYADVSGEDVLATLPRYHHEPMEEPAAEGARVFVTFRGQSGWVSRAGVDLFDYLSPALDEGEDRTRVVHGRIREARLSDVGAGWPASVVARVRAGQVVKGMTREQVDVAWGWPSRLLRDADRGIERWVWDRDDVEVIHSYEPTYYGTFHGPLGYAGGDRLYAGPRACQPYGAFQGDAAWTTYRIPVVERRVVTFGNDGRVRAVTHETVLR